MIWENITILKFIFKPINGRIFRRAIIEPLPKLPATALLPIEPLPSLPGTYPGTAPLPPLPGTAPLPSYPTAPFPSYPGTAPLPSTRS